MPNELARELCSEKKRVDAAVFQWFSHIERIDNSRNVKRIYKGKCMGRLPFGRPRRDPKTRR